MAKPQLNDLITWLRSNPLNRFEIYDVDQQKAITKCASIEDLGLTPENYFTDLVTKGVKTVQIVKKRKNGSSFKKEGCGLNYALTTEAQENVAASGHPVHPGATHQQFPPSFGLGSPVPGLGFSDIMEMKSASDRYNETREECRELKSKNERLEAENKRLESENLKHQFGIDTKPSALDKFLEGIAANPAAIPQIIAGFKGANAPGLNSPQPQPPQLSDIKNTVVDLVSNNKQVTDEITSAAYYIILESLKGNQQFFNSYLNLLQQYKIIENGSSNSSDNGNF